VREKSAELEDSMHIHRPLEHRSERRTCVICLF
jgi:hypothetical protein